MNRRSSLFVKAVCLTGCVLLTSVVSAGDLERLRYHTERKRGHSTCLLNVSGGML